MNISNAITPNFGIQMGIKLMFHANGKQKGTRFKHLGYGMKSANISLRNTDKFVLTFTKYKLYNNAKICQ